MPNPQLTDEVEENEDGSKYSDTYNYKNDIAFVEEASQLITGVTEVTATIADFDSACMDLISAIRSVPKTIKDGRGATLLTDKAMRVKLPTLRDTADPRPTHSD